MTRGVWEVCQIPDKSIIFPPDTWGNSLWGRAIREKRAFYANETFHTPDGHIPIESFLTVPIIFADKVIGLLSVGNKDGGYCDDDKNLQEIIASRISPILNARQQRDHHELERNRAEEALRLSNTYNRSLIEASLDPFCVIALDGKINDVNSATEQITGYCRKEIIGTHFTDYVTDQKKAEEGFRNALDEGLARNYSLQIRHRDGHITPVLYNASVFRSDNGEPQGVIAVARDITEQNKLEAKLLHSQKMEAIGLLAGGIAHDFNNIITGIIGFSTLIDMHMAKDDPLRDHLNHVLSCADRAAELTKSLLAFGRKQVMNPQPIDLNRIINKTEKFLERIIGEDVDIRMNFHQGELMVYADSGQIEQVLMNLATNARDAMPAGGTLTIATDRVRLDDAFVAAHGYGASGQYALLTVTDSGEGMDDETCRQIFDPFFTTKEIGKGTGLGLAVVYGIVKQHDGYVTVDSEPGGGTTFRIYLPLAMVFEKEGKADVMTKKSERGSEAILLAEDDETVRDMAVSLLESFGYEVVSAVDGVDAVRKFGDHRKNIRLLLFDVIMPNKNGIDAYEDIRKIAPDIKVIFASGYSAEAVHKKAQENDNVLAITKPYLPSSLLALIRTALDK